jgi:anti-sigma regulatory factor (Ser/Thr protein kinase)
MRAELRLKVPNDLAELARVNELVTSLLERAGVDASRSYRTCLALEEVLSNVIRHGFADAGAHEIAVRVRVDGGRVELEIVDDGMEFDPRSAAAVDVRAPLGERAVGGLGIHLVRAMVGEVRYERDGGKNRLRLCI